MRECVRHATGLTCSASGRYFVVIIDGQHRHASIGEEQKDMEDEFDWISERIPVYCTIGYDGTALSVP